MRGYKGELAAYFHFTEAKNVCQVESLKSMPKMQKDLDEKRGKMGRINRLESFLERQEEELEIEDYDK